MKDELTPRERVLLALDHQETDRVPVDFIATPESLARLASYLGCQHEDEVLRHLGVDLRHPRQPYTGPAIRQEGDGSWVDPWGVRRRRIPHEGGAYEEIVEHPLARIDDPSEIAEYPWPLPEWWDASGLAEKVHRLESETSYAIALEEFGDPGGIFEIAWYVRGMEQFLIDLIENPAIAYEIMTHVADFYLGMLDRVMSKLGNRIDLIWTSDDIAHQHGPMIGKETWRELIAPHHERLNRRVHQLGSRVMYHSCGSVRPFIPDLMDIGIDVLDVLQFSADGMDPEEIKSSFGDELCFHGGVDVQGLLPFGTEEEVSTAVRQLIEVLGRNGGYILSPTHNIQVDTPPENIVAIYKEAGSVL